MRRPIGSVAAVLTVALMIGAGSSIGTAGCALGPQGDVTPTVDPNIPGIDAAYNPRPEQPNPTDPPTPTDPPDSSTEHTLGSEGGADVAVPPPPGPPKPAAGEVLITEVMFTTNGPEPASEWFELHNVASGDRSLGGLIVKDGGGRSHVIVGPLTIAAGQWVVFARNKTAAITGQVPAEAIVYEYGVGLSDNAGVLLANGATGGLSLLSGATVIAAAPYGGWFMQVGSSVQLKVLDGAQSSVKDSWCLSSIAWTSGSGKGTPGAASNCP